MVAAAQLEGKLRKAGGQFKERNAALQKEIEEARSNLETLKAKGDEGSRLAEQAEGLSAELAQAVARADAAEAKAAALATELDAKRKVAEEKTQSLAKAMSL